MTICGIINRDSQKWTVSGGVVKKLGIGVTALVALTLGQTSCIVVGSDGALDLTSVQQIECDSSGLPFGGGTGAPSDPYVICTPTQFMNIAAAQNSDYILARNIDFGSTGFFPIPNFSGKLNGNYMMLSGIAYNSSNTYGGVFDVLVATAEVKNLGVSIALNLVDTGNIQFFGGIAGMSNGTISDVYVTASLSSNSAHGQDVMGGIVGNNGGTGTVRNSQAVTTTSSGPGALVHFGGLIGNNNGLLEDSSANVTMNMSANASGTHGGAASLNSNIGVIRGVTVSGGIWGADYLGGIAGQNQGIILYSTSNVDINTTGNLVGAVVGENSGPVASIENSTATAFASVLSGSGSGTLGGFVGRMSGGSRVLHSVSYAPVNSTTGSSVGGFVGEIISGGTYIYNSSAYGNAVSNGLYVGGFAGYVSVSSSGRLERVSAYGNANGSDFVGGLVGRFIGSGGLENIIESRSTGNVVANLRGGGIVGSGSGAQIVGSYSLSTVNANDPAAATPVYFGGIAGELDGSSLIRNCYFRGTLRNATNDPENRFGGLVGRTSTGTIFLEQSYFAGAVVDSTYATTTNANTYDAIVQNPYAGTSYNFLYYDFSVMGGTSALGGAIVGCSPANMFDGTNATCEVGLPEGNTPSAPWIFPAGGQPTLYWQ